MKDLNTNYLNDNNSLSNDFIVELNGKELSSINGGDGLTQAFFFVLGFFTQKTNDGFVAAKRGAPGAYIPNI